MHKKRGVTLIELLVSISIVVLFAAVVLPGFRKQTPEQALEQAALDVQSSILQARTLALAPQTKYVDQRILCFGARISGGEVNIYRYLDNGTGGCGAAYNIDGSNGKLAGFSKRLPNGVSVTPTGTIYEIKYKVAANDVIATGGSTIRLNGGRADIVVDTVTGRPRIIIN